MTRRFIFGCIRSSDGQREPSPRKAPSPVAHESFRFPGRKMGEAGAFFLLMTLFTLAFLI